MIPAEIAHQVNDLIHLPEQHSVHLLVELIEVLTDLLIVIGIVFFVAFVEQGQDRLAISQVRWMLCNMPFLYAGNNRIPAFTLFVTGHLKSTGLMHPALKIQIPVLTSMH